MKALTAHCTANRQGAWEQLESTRCISGKRTYFWDVLEAVLTLAACICGWEAVLVSLWRDPRDFPNGYTLWVSYNRNPQRATHNLVFHFKTNFLGSLSWPLSRQDLFFCLHSTTGEDFYHLPGDILFRVTNVKLCSNEVLLEAAAIIMLHRCSQDKWLRCRNCPEY